MKKARGKDRVLDWFGQWPIPLVVNGVLVCKMIADFLVVYADGREEFVEVKGMQTPVYRLKVKLLKALFPRIQYRIV